MLGVRGKASSWPWLPWTVAVSASLLRLWHCRGRSGGDRCYVKERKQFGRSISAFQNTQFELAEMKARVEAAKYLVYAAALKKQQAMDGARSVTVSRLLRLS